MNTDIFYEKVKFTTLVNYLNAAQWLLVDNKKETREYDWVLSCYHPGNSIAGYTDYTDHRSSGKSLAFYQNEVYEAIAHRLLQTGNYLNNIQKAFDTVVIILGSSGWSAEAIWSDGSVSYFTHVYTESAKRSAALREQEKARKKERAKERRNAKKA